MKRVLIFMLVVALVAATMIWFTSPSGFGNDPYKYDHMEDESYQEPIYELKVATVLPPEYRLHHIKKRGWRTKPKKTHARIGRRSVVVWCAKTHAVGTGYNFVGLKLFSADYTINQCWGRRDGKVTNRFHNWRETPHCSVSWGWACSFSREELVKGSGFSNKPGHLGIRYRYRRAYWIFERGIPGLGMQTVKPFVSATVRADGSYETDNGGS